MGLPPWSVMPEAAIPLTAKRARSEASERAPLWDKGGTLLGARIDTALFLSALNTCFCNFSEQRPFFCRITQQPRLVRCVPSLRRVQERPDPLHAQQRDPLDVWRLRAAYFCLGCDLGFILSGICCGALLERANTVYLPGKEDCRHLCGAQSTFFYLRFGRSRAVSMACLYT